MRQLSSIIYAEGESSVQIEDRATMIFKRDAKPGMPCQFTAQEKAIMEAVQHALDHLKRSLQLNDRKYDAS